MGGSFAQRLIGKLAEHDVDMVPRWLLEYRAPVVVARWCDDHIHPSLLPAFGGRLLGTARPRAALARGVKVTGATVHYVNDEPMLAKSCPEPVPVLATDAPQVFSAAYGAAE